MYPENIQQYVPPEFDLAKYETASDITLWDWATNFAKRCGIKYDIYDDELTQENISLGVHIHKDLSVGLDDTLAVLRDVTNYQVMSAADALDHKIDARKMYSRLGANDPFYRREDTELNQPVSETIKTVDWLMLEPEWLEIDLGCSDKEIKAAFEGWLQAKRAATDKNEKRKRRQYKLNEFSAPTLRRWYESRVLAYLDIEAWNTIEDNKITSKIYGDILFPEYKDKRDNTGYVNDTVKPLADLLTSQEVILRMRKVYLHSNRQKFS